MNYPVWDVSFGAGLLVAIVSILHVFVSHFAVGGGLFLVLTERRALRENDASILNWLRIHSKFFVLLTVVFGAISGVGIWFTISLIHPSATSSLVHAYVWGWAIEWVFFFIEITAALLYLYGWYKLPSRLHLWYGWIYFLAAFASMVVINGIITFMLTPGKWVETHEFWTGFFNPTFFPSLAVRTAIALALAGIYALITASRLGDKLLKARLVRWSAVWTLPALAVLPPLVWWYIQRIPPDLWNSAKGAMPTASHYALQACIFVTATFVLVLLTLLWPARLHIAHSLAIALMALGTMGAFEFVRESVRKPYVIANYLYDNSLFAASSPADGGFSVDEVNKAGVLNTARWVRHSNLTGATSAEADVAAGRDVFRVECQSCHTANAYRGVGKLLTARQWDTVTLRAMLNSLDLMHNGTMPPFAGSDSDRDVLSAYLGTLYHAQPSDGRHLFEQNCATCHEFTPTDPAITSIRSQDVQTASENLKNLPDLFVRMPDLKLSEQQRTTLVQWIKTQSPEQSKQTTALPVAEPKLPGIPPNNLIPALDPIPLPAPYWVFKLLSVVTFTLHILAMNFMLGGIILALASRWVGGREQANRLFSDIATKLPSLLPATVTLGVAPLLFLQLIYGQFFYTSSVLIAWPWFLLLVMLTVAYYGLYCVAGRAHRASEPARGVLLASFLLIASIGFVFSNNLTLSQTPSAWAGKYFTDPSSWNLNLSEPTLFARYLHFFVTAVAVGGLLLMLLVYFKRETDAEYRQGIFRFGGRAFEFATLAQFVIGFWFLVSLPHDQQALFLGDNQLATLLLVAGIAGALTAIMVVERAISRDDYRLGALGGTAATALVVLAMVVMRDILRDAYLKPYFHPERFVVQTQWTVLPLFLVVFLGGVVLWAVMLWRYPFTGGVNVETSRQRADAGGFGA